MSREGKRAVAILLIGIVTSVLATPTLATKLQLPVWLTYIVVALVVIQTMGAPHDYKECMAEVHIHQMGFGGFPRYTVLFFIIFSLLPVIAFIWLAWRFLS